MKVLVLGGSGMAGHVISTYLREQDFDVETLSETRRLDSCTHLINVNDAALFSSFLTSSNYDIVINCIAILGKQCDERQDLASYINAYLPHLLENHYRDSPTQIIHISSDGVFSGEHTPYNENSAYDGQAFYDRSKALGEIKNDKDLTIRTSIVGPDMRQPGQGLFDWFFRQSGEVAGYDKVFWNGVTTVELAKGISAVIQQKLYGVYHFSPPAAISKFELLQLFKDTFERNDIKLRASGDQKLDRILTSTRSDFVYTIPTYRVMLAEMKRWITSHPDLYPHYLK